ncbi:hypothetical protein BGZ65_005761 [Modicella reniformis]|uniref:Uncharacterized protein n=1 Tax=Modicella reniformis TaxID=1440133 RepID=A0A9P6IX04_9FUNG|nr:hypothetical protein BGZ65_005761 [Modicella reniformis]
MELLRHLYKRCPKLQVRSLTCTESLPSEVMLKTIAEFVLPGLQVLEIAYARNSRFSNTLVELSLAIKVRDDPDKERQVQSELQELTSLKKLRLMSSFDNSDKKAFWPWLCKRCRHVEEVMVERPSGFSKSLVFSDRMEDGGGQEYYELRESFHGGFRKELCYAREAESVDLEALGESHRIEVNKFTNEGPISGALKTWLCETTLTILKIRISDIPRPDLTGNWTVNETRTTDLKSSFDCLEMSLGSGLFKLAGLKELTELNVALMKTAIGPLDVEWMTKNWPRLRAIHGLNDQGDEAVVARTSSRDCPNLLSE